MRQRLERRSLSSNRMDDNSNTIMRRLVAFNKTNTPILNHLRARGPVYPVSITFKLVNIINKEYRLIVVTQSILFTILSRLLCKRSSKQQNEYQCLATEFNFSN
jgi:adenylate kinase family enzyme